MRVAASVQHPYRNTGRSADAKYGCRLDVGDRLKAGDAYAIDNGDWVTIQTGSELVGLVVGPGDRTTYVRPAATPRASATTGLSHDDREIQERRHIMGALRAIAHELGVDGPQELESGANARIAGMCIKRIREMRPAVVRSITLADCVSGPIKVTITGPQGTGKSVLMHAIAEALEAQDFQAFSITDGDEPERVRMESRVSFVVSSKVA